MLRKIFRFFAPPTFETDDEKTRIAAILNAVLLGTITLLIFVVSIQGFSGPKTYLTTTTAVIGGIALLSISLWFIMRRGYVRIASFIFITAVWIGLTYQAWSYSGLRDIAFIGYLVVVVAAGLLIGARTSVGYAFISALAGWVFAYFETTGKFGGSGDAPYPTARDMTIVFFLIALLSYLAINGINRALVKSRVNEQELRKNYQELSTLRSDLEMRVSERTTELQRRAVQMQAALDVGRAATSIRNLEELLSRITHLISQRFGFYHVGVFLLDERKEYAVLRAANSKGGQIMLKRGHKLQVGQAGIVGYVTGTGTPRIALDVGEDKVYFQNPDLPQTRSEMALPLAVSGNVIGALDVQSTEEAAFGEEDLITLRVMADQISIAIDNARLFLESQSAIESVRRAYGEIRSTAWQNIFVTKQKPFGYSSLSNGQIIPVAEESSPESLKAIRTGIPALSKDELTLHVPVKVLGDSIGVIVLKQRGSARWTTRDIEVVNTLSDQLGTALESARLYEQIRERARTESMITDITSKIGSSIELDTIMETTVEEIGRIFSGSEIVLQFKREE
jgi:GAF domain-containing protein